ncbi:hypothetical protein P7C70_g2146, partial [Phenoliferia sp. Uapishka_3]
MSTEEAAPSMINGHVQLVKGAISEALGYETGADTKAAGIAEMKAASSDEPPQPGSLLGSVESYAGKLTGCEGMEEEGKTRKELAGGATGAGAGETADGGSRAV